MRTLVLSDLHLGCGAHPRFIESGRGLRALLGHLSATPLRIILNGDTLDFTAEAHASGSDALAVMRGIIDDPVQRRVLRRLGEVIEAGGQVIVRPGECDPELRDPAIQELVVAGLGVSSASERHVSFDVDGDPTVVEVGGVKLLVTRSAPALAGDGRRLAVALLHSLRVHYGAGLAEHLRPDYEAAVLAAIAVNPTAVKLVLRRGDVSPHRGAVAELSASLLETLQDVIELPEERNALITALDPDLALATVDYPCLDRARLNLFRHCLSRRFQVDYQGLSEVVEEDASRLRMQARRLRASAAIFAYSHTPAWSVREGLCLVDTGSWGMTVDLPEGSSDAPWQQALDAWERIPRVEELAETGLAARAGLRQQQTAALIEPLANTDNARLALVEWRRGQQLERIREACLSPV